MPLPLRPVARTVEARPIRRLSARWIVALLAVVSLTSCNGKSGDNGAPPSSGTSGNPTSTAGAAAATKLFPNDFQPACQGITVSRARAYSPSNPGHKVVYFETYKGSLVDSSSSLPADWQVQFAADSDAYAAIDLVACAQRTATTFVKECTGYERDGQPTGNVARLSNATYQVTLHAAQSGATLASTTITTQEDTCPLLVSFETGQKTTEYVVSPESSEIQAFLKPYVQP